MFGNNQLVSLMPPKLDISVIKHSLTPFLPIIITLLLSMLITLLIAPYQEPVNILPFEEESAGGAGAGLNALFYLFISLIGGSFIFLMLKYKRDLLLKLFIGFAFFFSTFFITLFIIANVTIVVATIPEIIIIAVNLMYSLLVSYFMVAPKANPQIRNILILFLSSELGFFLGYNMPTWSTILILVVLSFYDIYAVKRGPIKKIVDTLEEEGEEVLPFLGYSGVEWQIGLGDLVFYSMFISHVLAFFGLLASFLVFLGILLGVALTYRLLPKYEMLPGLPLAIFFGICMLLLSQLIELILIIYP